MKFLKSAAVILISLGGFCLLINHYYARYEGSSHLEAFLVAKHDIPKGHSLSFENSKIVYLDLGQSSSHFLTNKEFQDFENLVLRTDISANMLFLKKDFVNSILPEENIPLGKRFFVLESDFGEIMSILKVGDVIDIIAKIDMPELGNATETILESMTIIDMGRHSNLSSQNYLSFYLTPDEVKILAFMKPYSVFSVVLRNQNDTGSSTESALTFDRFLQNDKIQNILKSYSFQIINGHKMRKKP